MRPPSRAPRNIAMPRMIPSFKSTTPRQTNTTVAIPEENTLITFVVATACRKVIPKNTTKAAVSIVT